MACVIRVHHEGLECDKCKKSASDSKPVLELREATGRGARADRNIVFVCVDCWDRAIAKDRKAVALPQ